jgi:SOS-response transcriptional repressor LexA
MRPVDPNNPKPQEVFNFIVKFKSENDGNSPSLEQIGLACDITSSSVVVFYLDKLEKAGQIAREVFDSQGDRKRSKSRIRNIRVIGAKWNPPVTATEPTPTQHPVMA